MTFASSKTQLRLYIHPVKSLRYLHKAFAGCMKEHSVLNVRKANFKMWPNCIDAKACHFLVRSYRLYGIFLFGEAQFPRITISIGFIIS